MSEYEVIAAFEVPRDVVNHPDVRLELTKYNGEDVVERAFLKGCKTCQKLLSKCNCAAAVESERWVYDRGQGIHVGMYRRINPTWLRSTKTESHANKSAIEPANPLRKEELAKLAPTVDRAEDGDTPAPPLSEFQQKINPQLIAHFLTVGVNNYFTYPADKAEVVAKLFESRGRKLHIRPLRDPKPETTNFRGGCSAVITFEKPEDMSILDQYPAAQKQSGGRYIVLRDYKLALQLFFDHGFDLLGPGW